MENEGERLMALLLAKAGVAGGSSAGAVGGGLEDDVELRPRRMDKLERDVFRFAGTRTSENDAVRRAVCAIAS